MNHTISNCCLHAYTSTYYSRHCLQGTQTAARQDTQPSAARDCLQPSATRQDTQPSAATQPGTPRLPSAFSQGLSRLQPGTHPLGDPSDFG
jgi:hypothetical protein